MSTPFVNSSVRPLGTPSSSNGAAPGPFDVRAVVDEREQLRSDLLPDEVGEQDRPFCTASAESAPASTPRNDIAAN